MTLSMKKIAILALFGMTGLSAHALDIGVNVARNYSGEDRNSVGVSVGQQIGVINTVIGISHENRNTDNSINYSVSGGYNIANLGPISLSAELGTTFVQNRHSENGYALITGIGVTIPFAKNVALTVDITRQYGQQRIKDANGNSIVFGVKRSF